MAWLPRPLYHSSLFVSSTKEGKDGAGSRQVRHVTAHAPAPDREQLINHMVTVNKLGEPAALSSAPVAR